MIILMNIGFDENVKSSSHKTHMRIHAFISRKYPRTHVWAHILSPFHVLTYEHLLFQTFSGGYTPGPPFEVLGREQRSTGEMGGDGEGEGVRE